LTLDLKVVSEYDREESHKTQEIIISNNRITALPENMSMVFFRCFSIESSYEVVKN
jgi:hypothetical protein